MKILVISGEMETVKESTEELKHIISNKTFMI